MTWAVMEWHVPPTKQRGFTSKDARVDAIDDGRNSSDDDSLASVPLSKKQKLDRLTLST